MAPGDALTPMAALSRVACPRDCVMRFLTVCFCPLSLCAGTMPPKKVVKKDASKAKATSEGVLFSANKRTFGIGTLPCFARIGVVVLVRLLHTQKSRD